MWPFEIGRGANVEQHHWTLVGHQLDGQRGSVHAAQAAQKEDGRGNARAGVAGGYDGVGTARFDQAHADVDRRIALAPDGLRRMLFHRNGFARLNKRDVARHGRRAEERLDARFVANEQDLDVGMGGRPVDGAANYFLWRVVSAHRVDGDANRMSQVLTRVMGEAAQVHLRWSAWVRASGSALQPWFAA